jgi:hypothetical protein
MKPIYVTLIFLLLILLTSCSSNTQKTSKKQEPTLLPKVTKPCDKINALINEYDNDFNKIKLKMMTTKYSRIWKAKYHLVGDNCQVWAWFGNKHTYSCSNIVPNKEIAEYYFQNAKNTAKSCLGTEWVIKESARKNDEGYIVEFNKEDSDLMLAAHMVPTASLFKSGWTVYYYIGSVSQVE